MASWWAWALFLIGPFVLSKFNELRHPPQQRQLNKNRWNGPIFSPFQSSLEPIILLLTIGLIGISIVNLVPVQYGFDYSLSAEKLAYIHQLFHTLYTSPTASTGIQSIQCSLRGGYRSDLFLLANAPITVSTTTIRSLLTSSPLLSLSFGPKPSESDIQTMIGKLSSFDGRKLYLLLGPRPFLDCAFCIGSNDYFWFAIPPLIKSYAWRILAIAIITTAPNNPISLFIKNTGRFFTLKRKKSTQPYQANFTSGPGELDRSGWRVYAVSMLVAMFIGEALVMYEFGKVRVGVARWNHWHANLHIARQVLYLLIVTIVYVFPVQTSLSSFDQSVETLRSIHTKLERTIAMLGASSISRQTFWNDHGLRDKVAKWHDSAIDSVNQDLPSNNVLKTSANKYGIDTTGLETSCRAVAQSIWHDAELVNAEMDKSRQEQQLLHSARLNVQRSSSTTQDS